MSELNKRLDKILTKLEQLGLAPIAIEKIATGDVFEAHEEAKQALNQLIAEQVRLGKIEELKDLFDNGYKEDSVFGVSNRALKARIAALQSQGDKK